MAPIALGWTRFDTMDQQNVHEVGPALPFLPQASAPAAPTARPSRCASGDLAHGPASCTLKLKSLQEASSTPPNDQTEDAEAPGTSP